MFNRILRISNPGIVRQSKRLFSTNKNEKPLINDVFTFLMGSVFCYAVSAVIVSGGVICYTNYKDKEKEKKFNEYVTSLKPINKTKLDTLYDSSIEQKQILYTNAIKQDLFEDFNIDKIAVKTVQNCKKEFIYDPFERYIKYMVPNDKICPILKNCVDDYKNQIKDMQLKIDYAEYDKTENIIKCNIKFTI